MGVEVEVGVRVEFVEEMESGIRGEGMISRICWKPEQTSPVSF